MNLLPAAPTQRPMPPTVFGNAPSGSAWVDMFGWYCGVKPSALSCGISVVLDEILKVEALTGRQLGSEYTPDAIEAVWKCVRALAPHTPDADAPGKERAS